MSKLAYVAILMAPFIFVGCKLIEAVLADPVVQEQGQNLVENAPAAVASGNWLYVGSGVGAFIAAAGAAAYKYFKNKKK